MAAEQREVGAAIKGFTVRGEEDAHRPTPLTGGGDNEVHVDTVQVGALFPVHLDADEIGIHDLGGSVILERFVGHHMAPMAGSVANAEEDGLVLLASLGEGLLAPWVPIDGVVSVLEQVRGGFVC